MRVIHKYPLSLVGETVGRLPVGAQVRSIQFQGDQLQMWVEVDTEAPLEDRHFAVVGTGHPISVALTAYLGTALTRSGAYVWHVYELLPSVSTPPAHWDQVALDVARRFTQDTEPQRRASLQVAVVEAIRRCQP